MFEHELNEYKSVQVTRIVHDFYDTDPKRGFYGGGGIDARIGPQPIVWADRIGDDTGAALGQRVQGAARRVSARDDQWPRTARRCRSRRTASSSIRS